MKERPGVTVASVCSVLFLLAGCANPHGYSGLIVAAVFIVCMWAIVLWTNRAKHGKKK